MSHSIRGYVANYIEGDPTIQVGIQRGLISSRILTKHILEEEKSFKGSFEDVRNAVRGYAEDCSHKVDVKKIYHAFKNCALDIQSKLANVEINKQKSLKDLFPILQELTRGQESFTRMLNNANSCMFIIKESDIPKLSSHLGKESILGVQNNLCAITLTLHPSVKQTPGIYFLIMGQIALHNINVFDIASYQSEFTVYVDQNDAAKAYQSLWRLCEYQKKFCIVG
ncbi:hypothetical protein HZB01_05335 [Candidatus Woesearchaeota archaeon]|nr:hypothetical protein [Candidatus Woesearchaeota archaeon]